MRSRRLKVAAGEFASLESVYCRFEVLTSPIELKGALNMRALRVIFFIALIFGTAVYGAMEANGSSDSQIVFYVK